MKYIKDYLHFYLGCNVQVTLPFDPENPTIEKLIELSENGFFTTDKGKIGFQDIKLILRPLSSLTMPEHAEAKSVSPYERDAWVRDAERTRYLLSKHFDLFRLIEAGLAIDAKTLTPTPQTS